MFLPRSSAETEGELDVLVCIWMLRQLQEILPMIEDQQQTELKRS
jgi:hypothetical protein